MNPNTFHVVDHPLIKHKLSIMREKDTGSKDFRQLLSEIAMLMCYEITRDIPVVDVEIETPVSKMIAQKVEGKKLAIVPILRAGLGMVDGILTLVPVAKVGHIGLYRDPLTHNPVEYYCKLPQDIEDRDIIGLAETGSGKTGAFAIPVIQRLIDNPQRMYALVLTPTRELAFQIAEQFEALGSAVGLKTAVIVGGVETVQQAIALGKKPHVIIATPGRLVDHLENTKVIMIVLCDS